MNRRNTIQRSLVLAAMQKLNHPTADDIYSAIKTQYPSISRGTVYRNLALLVEHGNLRKVQLAGGADHFDITLRNHYHITCRSCGKMIDADLPYQEGLEEALGDTRGFLIEGHDIALHGLCPGCAHTIVDEACPAHTDAP